MFQAKQIQDLNISFNNKDLLLIAPLLIIVLIFTIDHQ